MALPHRMRDLVRLTGAPAPTIHFYGQQGLLPAAEKTAGNQARYGDETVARIAWIRTLQQDLRLPLRTIREILERWGELPLAEVRTLLTLGSLLDEPDPTASEDEVTASSADLEPGDLAALRRLGLVGVEGRLTSGDARLVALVGAMRAAGFSAAHGFDIDQLGVYRDAVERLVEEEVRRFVEPALNHHDAAEMHGLVKRGVPLVDQLLALLHQRALQAELRHWLETTDSTVQPATA